jgi:glycosyltransferase involved in cell wall biosynthesis
MIATKPSSNLEELTPIALPALPARPLVSVLMANYNYARYIGQAIESVLEQTYSNWELIICDDGSSDSSIDIIQDFAQRDSRVRFTSQANGGHASALNTAYLIARGELLCLLDPDDLYLPTKLERVVHCCQKQSDGGVIVHRIIRINQNKRRQGVSPLLHRLPDGWHGTRLLEQSGLLPFMPPTSGLSLRREVAERLFPLPLKFPFCKCPDQVIARLAPLVTAVASVEEPLAEYRLHGTNSYLASRVTVASLSRELEYCEALWKEQYRFLSQINPLAAARLMPLDRTSYFWLMHYLRAKLVNDPFTRSLYKKYIAMLKAQPDAAFVFFWQSSFYLPKFIFEFAINMFIGQNFLKQLVAWIKGSAWGLMIIALLSQLCPLES